jgi:hypothetical protein
MQSRARGDKTTATTQSITISEKVNFAQHVVLGAQTMRKIRGHHAVRIREGGGRMKKKKRNNTVRVSR